MKFGIKGVYSIEDAQKFKALGFSAITLDLRPTSFNFCQTRIAKELVAEDSTTDYSCLFDNESIVNINLLCDQLERSVQCELVRFLQNEDLSHLKNPISLFFSEQHPVLKILRENTIQKIVLPEDYVVELYNNNELEELLRLLADGRLDLKIEVLFNWSSLLPNEFFKQFSFDYYSFEINTDVQAGYRVMDWSLVESNLFEFKRRLLGEDIP